MSVHSVGNRSSVLPMSVMTPDRTMPGPRRSPDSHATFHRPALAPSEWTGGSALLVEERPRSVVAQEDHNRALVEPELPQRVYDLSNAPVDFLHDIAVDTARAAAGELARGEEWHVRHRVSEIEKERPGRVLADERRRFLRIPPRDRSLIRRPLDDGSIAHQGHVPGTRRAGS